MKGLVLQHGPLGPPALLGEWLGARGVPYVLHEAWVGPPPDPTGFRFVASLGSEKSVASSEPAWIGAEVDALRAAVASEIPVLGLCFGGQALSAALGGGVDQLPRCEIGWLAIEPEPGDGSLPSGPWLHWHDDLLRVPPGARLLARSPAGPAAFRFGPHLGVQFHPEATAEVVDGWAQADERLEDRGVTRAGLAEQTARHAGAARDAAFALFDDWWARGPGSR